MQVENSYEIIGIGIGPFNLGLAAMCHNIKDLQCLFIDSNDSFNWHPGMIIPGTRLQVPFYADLVTLADPQSPFSYMAYLKAMNKMFRFAIRENYCIKRSEYNAYCRWVAEQLSSLKFNTHCTAVYREGNKYRIQTNNGTYHAKHIVIGTGTIPYMPENITTNETVFHSSDYLFRKSTMKSTDHIVIVGSGQSAAEIFYDLLLTHTGKLSWFTRSSRFFPMDFSKLSLELSTPDYIDHFYALSTAKRKTILASQDDLYKGINRELISMIYDQLDDTENTNIHLHPNCELKDISKQNELTFHHTEVNQQFTTKAERIILATGYQTKTPAFLEAIKHLITEPNRNYCIDEHNSIFIQNGEQSTHGFNASDLSLGPYRNAIIINSILQTNYYTVETGSTFQTFGLPNP